MIDLFTVIFTLLMVALFWFVYTAINQIEQENKRVKIPADIANDIVGERPYCPDCLSHDLRLVDPNSNLVWLKGLIPEIDYYECLKCGRIFSDEEWMDAKRYD
jgi:hypothetical protein